ncbi:unnamed protein product [Victoria cruziana]
MTVSAVLLAATFFWILMASCFSLNLTTNEACQFTTNPRFCESVLLRRAPSSLNGYSRYLLGRSLRYSERLSIHIRQALTRKATRGSGVRLGALHDCFLLSHLNGNYLNSTFATLSAIDDGAELAIHEADDVHTLLSAIVTNQETCHDGLKRSFRRQHGDDLQQLVADGSELYRASLALFALSRDRNGPGKGEVRRNLLRELRVRRDGVPHWVDDKKLFRSGPHGEPGADGRLLAHGHVVVAPDGSGDFRSVNDAIAAAPMDMHPRDGYHVIRVKAGVYKENIRIGPSHRRIMLVGDGAQKSIITGRRSMGGGYSTLASATLTILADDFVAIGITIRNTAGPAMGQAVAVLNGGDRSVFYRCSIEGHQDTLCVHSFRQFYRECNIFGTVDFIFGDAAVVFQLCNIYARMPLSGQAIMVTAQGRVTPHQKTGIAILHSNILPDQVLEAAAARGRVRSFLGRPWKEYSRTVVMLCKIGGFIDPAGWSPWSGDFALRTLYYGEYKNRGAGATTRRRVDWPGYHLMTRAEAKKFTARSLIDGDTWLPATKVPFSSSLQ